MAFGHIWLSPNIESVDPQKAMYKLQAGITIATDVPTGYYTLEALVSLGDLDIEKDHVLSFSDMRGQVVAQYNMSASELRKAGITGRSINLEVELKNIRVYPGRQEIRCSLDDTIIDTFPLEFLVKSVK